MILLGYAYILFFLFFFFWCMWLIWWLTVPESSQPVNKVKDMHIYILIQIENFYNFQNLNLIGIYFLVTVLAHQTTMGFPYSLVQLTQNSFKGFISCLGEACFIMKRLHECVPSTGLQIKECLHFLLCIWLSSVSPLPLGCSVCWSQCAAFFNCGFLSIHSSAWWICSCPD